MPNKLLPVLLILLFVLSGFVNSVSSRQQPLSNIIAENNTSPGTYKSHLISPVPLSTTRLDGKKIALGKRLFFDDRLSKSNISCVACHQLSRFGTDGLTTTNTTKNRPCIWNTPSIYNLFFQSSYGWNGRLKTLEEQLLGVLSNELHMNGMWQRTIDRLAADSMFNRLFNEYGCIACHQGTSAGGGLLAKFGVFNNPFENQQIPARDLGLEAFTDNINDRHIFRVASLKNVAQTAPYFHPGEAETLEQAVWKMGKYQLNRNIPNQDIKLIVAFLTSLTGEIPQ